MRQASDNLYSRIIAGMKIALPLAALGILSTLFFLSNSVDPVDTLQIAELAAKGDPDEQGMSNPRFAGVTRAGDKIVFMADSVQPDPDNTDEFVARSVSAQLQMVSGGSIEIGAKTAQVNQGGDQIHLRDTVRIETSDGFRLDTEALRARFTELHVESDGPVSGSAPFGTLEAGKLLVHADSDGKNASLLLSQGVKLIYTPRTSKE